MMIKQSAPQKSNIWKYALVYLLLFMVNLLPSITERPYLPQDSQDVIINLLSVAVAPYHEFALILRIATLLLIAAILVWPGKLGRLVAGYISINFFVIAAVQTMGHTQKYGFVIHTAALVTMLALGLIWLVVAIRNDLSPTFKRPTLIQLGLILLAFVPFWGPYVASGGVIRPDFDVRLLLTSPDYGLTFCFTTPVFLVLLVMFYPQVNRFAFRVTAFCGFIYALFNLTHFFNPAMRWMGFMHLPLLILSLYALVLPLWIKSPAHSRVVQP